MSTSANPSGRPDDEGRDDGTPDELEPTDAVPEDADGVADEVSTDQDVTGDDSDNSTEAVDADDASTDGVTAGEAVPAGSRQRRAARSTRRSDDVERPATRPRGRSGAPAVTGRPAARGTQTRRGPIAVVVLFVRQVIAELRKVVTPTRNELGTYIAVVLVFVVAVMAYVGLLDFAFGRLVLWAFGG